MSAIAKRGPTLSDYAPGNVVDDSVTIVFFRGVLKFMVQMRSGRGNSDVWVEVDGPDLKRMLFAMSLDPEGMRAIMEAATNIIERGIPGEEEEPKPTLRSV